MSMHDLSYVCQLMPLFLNGDFAIEILDNDEDLIMCCGARGGLDAYALDLSISRSQML